MNAFFSRRSILLFVFCLTWLVGIAAGMYRVLALDSRASTGAQVAERWPFGISRAASYSLVMVVHPHCPCSRASVAELAQLMARSAGHLRATVLFVRYAGFSQQWVQTDTWSQAKAIPGVRVAVDNEGVLARRFGVRTSGQTFIFDGSGRLLFQGGLTGSRGHEGDNANMNAALAVLHQPPLQPSPATVYGCSLQLGAAGKSLLPGKNLP